MRREVQPRTPRRFNTAESSSAAQPTPRVPLLCVPGLLRVCPFEGSGEYSVSCSMLRPGRPGQRSLGRTGGPIRRSHRAGIDYTHHPPPFAPCVRRRGAIVRHFTGISLLFLRDVSRISRTLTWSRIEGFHAFFGAAGRLTVYRLRSMGMIKVYGYFLEDGA
jgi:hypothetical protein